MGVWLREHLQTTTVFAWKNSEKSLSGWRFYDVVLKTALWGLSVVFLLVLGFFWRLWGGFLCVCCVGVFCLGSFCGFLFVCFTSLIYLFLKHSLKLWENVFWPHTVTSRCVFLVIVFIGGSLLLAKFILNLISVVKKETYFCACKLLGHLVWL